MKRVVAPVEHPPAETLWPTDFFEKPEHELKSRWAEDFEEPDPEKDLVLWVIHNRLTPDHPGFYVLRREWSRDATRIVDRGAWLHHDLGPLRKRLPPGLCRQPRQLGDPCTVEEAWL